MFSKSKYKSLTEVEWYLGFCSLAGCRDHNQQLPVPWVHHVKQNSVSAETMKCEIPANNVGFISTGMLK